MAPATPQEFSRTGPLVPAAPAVPPPATEGNVLVSGWQLSLTEAFLPIGRSTRDPSGVLRVYKNICEEELVHFEMLKEALLN